MLVTPKCILSLSKIPLLQHGMEIENSSIKKVIEFEKVAEIISMEIILQTIDNTVNNTKFIFRKLKAMFAIWLGIMRDGVRVSDNICFSFFIDLFIWWNILKQFKTL